MRTADDLLARAESRPAGRSRIDRRCRSRPRDISRARRAAAARVRARAAAAQAAYDRPHRGAAGARALHRRDAGRATVVWLADGVDAGRAKGFVAETRAAARHGAPVTVVDGGIAPAPALAAADNAAGALTVKVLRAVQRRRRRPAIVRALDLKRLPLGDARFAFKRRRPRDRGRVRAAGRDPQRHRPPRNRRRAIGRRRAAARQALAPPHRRRRLRRDRRYRAAAARVDLLSGARARPVRRRARRRDASPCGSAYRASSIRTCRCWSSPTSAPSRATRERGSPSGSRTAACWCASPGRARGRPTTTSCRCSCAAAAARSAAALSWEQPQPLGGFARESPFAGHGGAGRRHCQRARCWPSPTPASPSAPGRRLPTARRWSPPTRRGKGMIVLFHVTADTALVEPAAVRRFRRHAASASSRSPAPRATGRQASAERDASAGAAEPRARRLRRLQCRRRHAPGRPGRLSPAAPPPIIRPASTARRKDCSRVNTLAAPIQLKPHRLSPPLECARRGLSASSEPQRPARPGLPRRAWRCCCSTRWSCSGSRGGFARLGRGGAPGRALPC